MTRFLNRPAIFGLVLACAAMVLPAAPSKAQPATQVAPDYSAYILTPPAPKTPRINGPVVYGERPGRPLFYAIPATGDRPMAFSVRHLPRGLKLDRSTGWITGSVTKPGSYDVVLSAKNALGRDSKKFEIVIGDHIALTPPMGWNSWNVWAWSVSQAKVVDAAKAMASSGLAQYGWSYINTDDTWQGKADPVTHALQGNDRFPDMKSMVAQIHALGLKAGIYSTPWIASYGMYPGGSADTPDRAWTPPSDNPGFQYHTFGKYSFSVNDADQWASWGFDYLKYDWNPNDVPHVTAMADSLRASGRDIVFSLSNSAPFEHAADWARLANCWRTTGDITDNYESICANGFTQSRWAPYSGPGHWNDADMLVVGVLGWGPSLHPTHLSPDEQYTHISLWCLLSAPLLLGCDLDKLDPFTKSLLTNDEVLAIDQDPAGKAATCVATEGGNAIVSGRPAYARFGTTSITLPREQIWEKSLADGSVAVGLFNLGDSPTQIAAKFSDLKLIGRQRVRDLWRQKDLGVITGEYDAVVPSHGVVLVKIGPA